MKVAFATQDRATVDAHFGTAPHLVVWEVAPGEARELSTFSFQAASEDGDHGKLGARLEAIAGCSIVFVAAIGAAAASFAVSNGILPVRVAPGEPIAEAAGKLGRVLAGTPPPWLRNALNREREAGQEGS